MNIQNQIETARALAADGKGILAMDESTSTANKRFAAIGIPQTEEMRRRYREMIVTTPGLGQSIAGAILYDETIRQSLRDGTPFVEALKEAGIIPGIKVDAGTTDLALHPGEKVTEGLDGLRNKLAQYVQLGAHFAKWRGVITIKGALPTDACIGANAEMLARYAALCQEAGLVPIVEPEVLMDGDHLIETCRRVTERVLHAVFDRLYDQGVVLEAMILKPNMVTAGLACPEQESVDEVAGITMNTLLRHVPASVPVVAFLSGGQSGTLASARLSAMNIQYRSTAPWAISFSFARAVQQPALDLWMGDDSNVSKAQAALAYRASCNRAARLGTYVEEMEYATK